MGDLQKFFRKSGPFSEGQEFVSPFKAWFKAIGLISQYSLYLAEFSTKFFPVGQPTRSLLNLL